MTLQISLKTKQDDPCDNVGHWLDFIMNRGDL